MVKYTYILTEHLKPALHSDGWYTDAETARQAGMSDPRKTDAHAVTVIVNHGNDNR